MERPNDFETKERRFERIHRRYLDYSYLSQYDFFLCYTCHNRIASHCYEERVMLSDFFINFFLTPAGIISLVPGSLFLWFIVKSVRYLWSLPQCTIEKARKTLMVAHEAKTNLLVLVFIDALYFIDWNAPPLQTASISLKWIVLAVYNTIMLYMSLFGLAAAVLAKRRIRTIEQLQVTNAQAATFREADDQQILEVQPTVFDE